MAEAATATAMKVRIKQKAKSAMQSGTAGAWAWVLEVPRRHRSQPDPLIGWPSSRDTAKTIRLEFASLDEAVAYAEAQGFAYVVAPTRQRRHKPKAYADNFAVGRKGMWTH